MIIKDLFANLTIIISLLFIYAHLTKSSPLRSSPSIKRKILVGAAGGLASNVLMQYSIEIGTTIIDLRHIPVILLASTGGALPTAISVMFVMIGRFLIGVNLSSYVSIMFIVSVAIFSIWISKIQLTRNTKILYMLTFSNISFSFTVIYLIEDISFLLYLIPLYWTISYAAGYLAFYILEFLRDSQMLLEKYKEEAKIDGLTGLNNVRRFDEVFNKLTTDAKTNNKPLSLLYIDVDFFKRINDTYGHTEGDAVLKQLGLLLRKGTRSFDLVSRNGGEEFTVVLIDCQLNRAIEIAENIRKAVEKNKFSLNDGQKITLTISVGIASYGDTTNNINMLIEEADRALYQAKKSGRNKICVAD
ncbi:GGDEF domain-containing protein [Bacillus sp. PK3_68]|uniref:GGDEF domain-containing protein n=1 Tax=Bacillus sp. PK3_68 TaxID=2027408 RepID=UPI000E70C6A6|nr:GGDEF domain-containing protein [Bacillus sp. PK3_68]RJS62285.1 GGDEF domain-containing protein [Bacillus sp. PK3_68]